MDDIYQINVAKTEFREAYNRGDVDQLLSVFGDESIVDMSEDGPSRYDLAAREGLREDFRRTVGHHYRDHCSRQYCIRLRLARVHAKAEEQRRDDPQEASVF